MRLALALDAVTCEGDGDCWAVGGGGTSSTDQTLVEQETGGVWSVVPGPTTTGSTAYGLFGLTCAATDDCWAVGDAIGGAGPAALVEQYTASGLSVISSSGPAGSTQSILEGVTCVSGGDCWAVGHLGTSGGVTQPLIEEGTT